MSAVEMAERKYRAALARELAAVDALPATSERRAHVPAAIQNRQARCWELAAETNAALRELELARQAAGT